METSGPRTWLLMAAGDNRGHAGNGGYDDQAEAYYSWDSNVPNAKSVAVGDVVVLWDKSQVLGVSVIENIDCAPGVKVLQRCPRCATTRIAERRTKTPRFRCMKSTCHEEFDEPDTEVADVEKYVARYDAGWTALEGVVEAGLVTALALHAGDFNAMRPVSWTGLSGLLEEKGADRALSRLTGRVPESVLPRDAPLRIKFDQGHRQSVVRVRRGQSQFRNHLLETQGEVCAFTGAAPRRALEAGHLYSYAKLGQHHQYGGLILRRDIHRLFDDGMLALDPLRLTVDVSGDLKRYPQYGRLHGNELKLDLREEQIAWLRQHWDEHRSACAVPSAARGVEYPPASPAFSES
ncbi:HNH endonuclease signature motif containing protein [Demequina sp. NBRC 110051]|uniref:HNH endonuclease signature motif containing protein n=1 Tax=Demequina sp. NBRC 110051 TaxID=1570340 RepID=UPI00117DA64D|nr:HNH endonuclease signature motif containing protein [Demequina sp. NBRC 110051]